MLASNSFCKQAILNREIILSGDQYQERDFIPISHIENLTHKILDNSSIDYYGKVMNVGSERSLSIIDLAKKISKRCKVLFGFEPNLIESQQDQQKKNIELNYNCRKFKSLNIFSQKTLEDEIDELLKFCKKNFNSLSQ
jgi:UDP-glucose 4-epimerase